MVGAIRMNKTVSFDSQTSFILLSSQMTLNTKRPPSATSRRASYTQALATRPKTAHASHNPLSTLDLKRPSSAPASKIRLTTPLSLYGLSRPKTAPAKNRPLLVVTVPTAGANFSDSEYDSDSSRSSSPDN